LTLRLLVLWAHLAAAPGPWGATEPRDERLDRLSTIVLAADIAAREVYSDEQHLRAWTAALLAKGEPESNHWDLRVHSGAMRGDGGKAICLGQVHASRLLPRAEWARTVGTDEEATVRCWRAVLRYLRGFHGLCGGEYTADGFARAFAAYGSAAGDCTPTPWSRKRASRWAYLVERVYRVTPRR